MRALACLLALTTAAPLAAQSVDCDDPADTAEINYCMERFYQESDAELNVAYALAMDQARRLDSYDLREPSNVALMRDAQRKWITFRDAACEAESTLTRGGTMQTQLYLGCMERLSRLRAEDLQYYGEGF